MGFFGGINTGINQGREYAQKNSSEALDALLKRAQLKEAGYDVQPQGRSGMFGEQNLGLVQDPNSTSLKTIQKKLEEQKLQDALDPNHEATQAGAKETAIINARKQAFGGGATTPDPNSQFILNPSTGQMAPNKDYTSPEKLSEHQDALEQKYREALEKQLSNRSGGLGSQDAKVNQAVHLRSLLDQYYDPKTGNYNVPASQYEELAIGHAGLVSGGNAPSESMVNGIKQRTAKGDFAGAMGYVTGKTPTGTTQDVLKNLAESIDRQGTTSEDLRDQAVKGLKDLRPTKLEQKRAEALEKAQLGTSYKSYLEKSPSRMKSFKSEEEALASGYKGTALIAGKKAVIE